MSNNNRNSYLSSLLLVGALFFIFGFISWLNSTLIPFLQTTCELNDSQAYLVTFAFYISYFVMALPSSAILKATGFKNGMSLGLLVMAAGTLIFIPAANQRNYGFFLTGLFTQGLGLSILQTAVNPYVTILGPEESAARRISIMGVANKFAGIVSPVILASILLKNSDELNKKLKDITDAAQKNELLNELAQRIVSPYTILAIVLVVLAILIRISPLPELKEDIVNPDIEKNAAGNKSIFHHTYLFLGAIGIFFCVGVEVIAGDTIINYGKYLDIPIEKAKFFTSMTLSFMVAGYFVGIALIPKFISQAKALKIYTIIALLLSLGVVVTEGMPSVYCLSALGFSNAIMWPAIWPMSLKGLGTHTKRGSAFLIMGIAGGALLPLLYGFLSNDINKYIPMGMTRHSAYILLIPCYLYILFFAVKGHKMGYTEKAGVPKS